MPTFPRRGVTSELSTGATVRFPGQSWERPGFVVRFGAGWTDRRTTTEGGRYKDIKVIVVGNETDIEVVRAFLDARGLFAESFDLIHSRLGTIPVNYVGTELPMPVVVDGDPGWYQLELTMEGRF